VSTFKFIHCADLHLGSRSYGIAGRDPELGKKLRESVFESFSRIIDRAVITNTDFMVISGDIFDETTETPATRLRFAKELEKVKIPVYICLGNHDHVMSWTESIPYPENVHVFGSEPESIILQTAGGPVEIVGKSFPERHSSENPTIGIAGRQGMFSIAVLHCSLDKVAPDTEYGPCSLSDMVNKGIDYWALGHIHKRTEVSADPYVIYPGNIQGRSRKEIGEKGAYMVTVTDDRVTEAKFFATQEIVWKEVSCDITGKDINSMIGDVVSKAGTRSMVSLTFTGKGVLDAPLRSDTGDIMGQIEKMSGCKITDVTLNTYPPMDREKMSAGSDMSANVIRSSDRILGMGREEIIDTICKTKQSESIRYMLEWLTDDELRGLVRDAEVLIIDRLAGAVR
jgi:exonuclease SbcD